MKKLSRSVMDQLHKYPSDNDSFYDIAILQIAAYLACLIGIVALLIIIIRTYILVKGDIHDTP